MHQAQGQYSTGLHTPPVFSVLLIHVCIEWATRKQILSCNKSNKRFLGASHSFAMDELELNQRAVNKAEPLVFKDRKAAKLFLLYVNS